MLLTAVLIGNAIRARVEFADTSTLAPVTPAAVRVRFVAPDGTTETVYTPVASLGVALADHTPDVPGSWWVRVESDNPDAAAEGEVVVAESQFPAPD